MLKKRLCSMLLIAAVSVGSIPAAAAVDNQEEITLTVDDVQMDEEAETAQEMPDIDVLETEQEETADELPAEQEEIPLEQEEVTVEPQSADKEQEQEEDEVDPESEDGERFQKMNPEPQEQLPENSISMLSSKTFKSPLTGQKYSVPSSSVSNIIDVSKWDATIDWNKVKKAGVSAAIIRVGYRGYSNGDVYPDEYFASNIKNATKAGIKVGVYFYSQAKTKAEARAEARYCINKCKGYKLTLPIVMDVEYAEDENGYTGRFYKAKLSRSELTNMCLAFADECKSAGYQAMIYANKTMLENKMDASAIHKKAWIWMAHYTSKSSYKGKYELWQYSETGRVSGIKYAIDCNFGFDLNLVPASKVSVSSSKTMAYGNTLTLKASVAPSNTSDKVKWSSKDTKIATVSSSGKVTPKKVGVVKIQAKAGSKSDTCKVTIRPRRTEITKITAVSKKSIKLTWKKKSEAKKYYIYRATSKNGKYKRVGTTTKTQFTNKGLKSKKTYYYKVYAVNGSVRSLASAVKQKRTK